jgi:segregation and condensation protein B
MDDRTRLKQIIEGAILAADRPISVDMLAQLFTEDPPSRSDIRETLQEIAADCEGRGFELNQVANGYRFQVRQELGDWIGRLWEERPPRYSRAMLETLALIAYRQPITRGDIEEIRGVTVSTNIMRALMEREWVRVVGHRDVPGRPALYATTREFLDYFNLRNLDELPTLSEIRDIGGATEELDLEEEPLIRSLELDADADLQEEQDEVDLSEVTERVTAIQENIRQFVQDHMEEDDSDVESEDDPDGPDESQ